MSEHANKAHSRFGGSVISRVIACPGSASLCATVPSRPSSAYADEGTFAHQLGEMCLRNGQRDADMHVGAVLSNEKIGSKKAVTEEMAAAVQVYLDAVYEEVGRSADPVMEIEQRFTLPIASADEGEVFGANDCLVYHPSLGRLVVFDYKHGQGVSVSAEDNAQLKFYAAGAALSHPEWRIAELVLVIVQPRARDAEEQEVPGVKPWPMDTFELLEFVAEVEQAVALSKSWDARLRDNGSMPIEALKPGSWCRWCDAAAAAVCPAKEQEVVASIGVDFSDIAGISPQALPKPADMDTARIAALLQGLSVLDAWAAQVRDFAFGLLQQGVPVPGFKLVDKVGRRKWIDNESEIAGYLEVIYGVDADDAYPRKLVTITEVERLIKARIPASDKAGRKEALDDLSLRFTLKDSSGQTMAPDTDRRDAVTAGAAADFAGINLNS